MQFSFIRKTILFKAIKGLTKLDFKPKYLKLSQEIRTDLA